MWAMVVVALQKGFHSGEQACLIFRFILAPTQAFFAFFSHGAVEALDVRLLVFLVWSGNAVPAAVVPHLQSKLGFKLTTAISLHDLHKAIKAPPHAAICSDARKPRHVLR